MAALKFQMYCITEWVAFGEPKSFAKKNYIGQQSFAKGYNIIEEVAFLN